MPDVPAPPDESADHWWQGGFQDGTVPSGFDASVPSPARMYDYYLGGKDNFAADREAADKALAVVPQGKSIARANRGFLARAVVLMADRGIRQFIDLGTGIPTRPNVHELARGVQRDARVLYVDNDPVVNAYNRALLADSDGIRAVCGDIREPDSILADTDLKQLIDFSQPVGVLFVAVLHFIFDEADPAASVAAFTDQMVSGSYLAISHIASDGTGPEVMATIRDAYAKASAPAVFRTSAQIGAFFGGLDLEPPGLVDVTDWPPAARMCSATPAAVRFLGGVGHRK
jgi:S-adenosyl methyltransferase